MSRSRLLWPSHPYADNVRLIGQAVRTATFWSGKVDLMVMVRLEVFLVCVVAFADPNYVDRVDRSA